MPDSANLSHYFLERLQTLGWWDELAILTNVVLLLSSGWLVQKVSHRDPGSAGYKLRLTTFRAINILLIVLIILNAFLESPEDLNWVSKIIAGLMVVYAAFLSGQVFHYLIHQRYGKQRSVNGVNTTIETYKSRLLELIATVVIVLVTLVALVQILGFSSLLQAGGAIGVLGVILALTQGSWAPDLVSGLIVLNSGLIEEGDVVRLDGDEPLLAEVFKTKLFHTELLDLRNNHRVMLANSRLRSMTVGNLSKFASAKGLREQLHFDIGYDVKASDVESMFADVIERLNQDRSINVERQHAPDVRVTETGNDAVRWTLFYYTKDVRQLISTRHRLLRIALEESVAHDISLATPRLEQRIVDH